MSPTTTPLTISVFIKNAAYIPAAFLLAGVNTESYAILTAFMAADLLLGIIRTLVLNGGTSFKSYKLAAGVLSKCLVTSVPLIVVWAGRGAGISLVFLAQWSVGALILSQAYSMLGHVNAIRLGQDVKEWDAVGVILGALKRSFEALLRDSHSKEE